MGQPRKILELVLGWTPPCAVGLKGHLTARMLWAGTAPLATRVTSLLPALPTLAPLPQRWGARWPCLGLFLRTLGAQSAGWASLGWGRAALGSQSGLSPCPGLICNRGPQSPACPMA